MMVILRVVANSLPNIPVTFIFAKPVLMVFFILFLQAMLMYVIWLYCGLLIIIYYVEWHTVEETL